MPGPTSRLVLTTGSTLPSVLDAVAAARPDTPVTFPSANERVSVAELARASQAVARGLVGSGVRPGDRVGVLSRNDAGFLTSLFAVARAGAAACPLPLPTSARDLTGYAYRLLAVTSAAGVRRVVTGAGVSAVVRRLAPVLGELTFASVDEVAASASAEGAGRLPTVAETDLAVVQFTSGSTALPKGVALTHRNVVHGVAAIVDGIRLGAGEHRVGGHAVSDHGGSWLPLFHDMGLFGSLSAVLTGVPMTIWSPGAFVKDPAGWLRDFLGRGCTVCPAPNFGYETLLGAVPAEEVAELDMSRWRVALNGAEPVRPATVEQFCERFAPAGFAPASMFPVFGMAEATLAVTFPPLGRPPLTTWVDRDRLACDGLAVAVPSSDATARGLVALGRPVRGMQVRVVAEDGSPRPDDVVGDIEVRGDSVTSGYLSLDPVTTGLVAADGWLRTGDLGFQRDGDLYVSGRRKEMIVVRGVNYYPEDAEAAVRDAPGVYRGRCVAVADPATAATGTAAGTATGTDADSRENITIIAETSLTELADQTRLTAELRLAVTTALGVPDVTVLVVAPDMLPRTSSGKFQRLAARELVRTRRK